MEEAVRARIVPLEGLSFVRSDGRPYGILRASGNPDQQTVISEYEIYRDDLARVLFDMTKGNEKIKYIFGEQIASMGEVGKNDHSIRVDFEAGTPSADFDLVVACDGATSRTRAMGLGCKVRDYTESSNSWAAYFSISRDMLDGSRIGQGFNAPRGRFISIEPDPSGRTRVSLMAMNPRSDADEIVSFRQASKRGEEHLKRHVAERFRGAGWRLDEIMQGMMVSQDFYASEILQVKTPSLYRGRFVMVGDAGYAPGPTGGGTTLAMAGAYVLAGEIYKHAGDVEAGLRGYGETMRPLITDLQKIPPFASTFLAPQTAWGIWIRNQIFAFITWSGIVEVVSKYFANSFASTDKFPLPDYGWPD